MNEVTEILSAIEEGDPRGSDQLLALVYDELRKLAAANLAREKPGQTLQATALVHEAYLRLICPGDAVPQRWDSRGHFFAAAAEAMRRILIERARQKATLKRGAGARHLDLEQLSFAIDDQASELFELDDALRELDRNDAQAAQLVKLRFFAGLTHQQAADALGITRRSADRLWVLAKAWLYQHIGDS